MSLWSSCDKKCEEAFVGDLCFENKTDSFNVEVYVNNQKRYTLAPGEERCEKNHPAGSHAYGLVYLRIGPGQGFIASRSVYVRPCERTLVEAR
jgi:hypothetical protein